MSSNSTTSQSAAATSSAGPTPGRPQQQAHIDPPSASSSDSATPPSPPPDTLADEVKALPTVTTPFPFLPRLMVVTPPKGIYSNHRDERCFTYCSQSVRGRTFGEDPWCRTICWRRVRSHETQKTTAYPYETPDPPPAPTPIPLPPEGQPSEALTRQGEVLDGAPETRYWREGRYVWWSTSRWMVQEKLDMMMSTLEKQFEFMRWREIQDRARVYAAEEDLRRRVAENNAAAAAAAAVQTAVGPAALDVVVDIPEVSLPSLQDEDSAKFDTQIDIPPSGEMPYVDDSALPNHQEHYGIPPPEGVTSVLPPMGFDFRGQTQLIAVAPLASSLASTVSQNVSTLLEPTSRVLSLLSEMSSDGSRTRFTELFWDKLKTGGPRRLTEFAAELYRDQWKLYKENLKQEEQRQNQADGRRRAA